MMTCAAFRAELRTDHLSAEALAHMRSCTSCLEAAVAADPENLFRSLGGGEILPPDGVDSFATDVMQEVRLRTTERSMRRTRFTPLVRWSAAAALALVIGGITWTRWWGVGLRPTQEQPKAASPIATVAESANLSIIESYEETGAMLVELPGQEGDDIKVVMIFDETLPVDL